MDSLLADINQAGLGRGLQFELFKPGANLVKEFYAEMPIETAHEYTSSATSRAMRCGAHRCHNVAMSAEKDVG